MQAGQKRKAAPGAGPSSSAPADAKAIAAAVKRIKQITASHEAKGGVRQEVLESEMMKVASQAAMLAALNQLMSAGTLVGSMRANNKLVFKLQSEEDAAKFTGLTAEDRLILQEVEKGGTNAISSKDIRYRAGGVPQQQLAKVLKKLEARKLIKAVKSVSGGNMKKYMLFGLTPSREITGGSWYNGGEFDHELIRHLQQASISYIQREERATAADVHAFIRGSGLIKGTPLREADINSILTSLVYDARLEMTRDSIAGDEKVYKLIMMEPGLERAFTSVPCATCPVSDQCSEFGDISPATCTYMTRWLDQATGKDKGLDW